MQTGKWSNVGGPANSKNVSETVKNLTVIWHISDSHQDTFLTKLWNWHSFDSFLAYFELISDIFLNWQISDTSDWIGTEARASSFCKAKVCSESNVMYYIAQIMLLLPIFLPAALSLMDCLSSYTSSPPMELPNKGVSCISAYRVSLLR